MLNGPMNRGFVLLMFFLVQKYQGFFHQQNQHQIPTIWDRRVENFQFVTWDQLT